MKYNVIILATILFISYGCKEGIKKQQESIQEIAFTAKPENILFSEVYKNNYKIIKLESAKESLFSYPDQTRISDDYIFILDRSQKKFLIFDKEGNFLQCLYNPGQGPREYTNLTDFTIDDKNKYIYLYDDAFDISKKKIIIYDFKLNYISEIKVPFYFSKFDIINNDDFVFFTGIRFGQKKKYQYDIIISDQKLNIDSKYLPYRFTNATRGFDNTLLRMNYPEQLYFYISYSNIIYEIENDNFSAKYKITDFNGHKLPPDDFYIEREKKDPGKNFKTSKEIMNSEYIYSYIFYENNNKVICYYTADKKLYVSLIDFETNKEWHTSDNLTDDYGLFLDIGYTKPFFFHENRIGYYFFPYIALEEMEKSPNRYVNPSIENLNVTDNPFIVLFELK